MTYQDDPNGNLRRTDPEGANYNYTGWVVGGAVALAVVLGVFMMSDGTNNSGMANDSPTISRPATEPTTTGSGSSQPSIPPAGVPTTPLAR